MPKTQVCFRFLTHLCGAFLHCKQYRMNQTPSIHMKPHEIQCIGIFELVDPHRAWLLIHNHGWAWDRPWHQGKAVLCCFGLRPGDGHCRLIIITWEELRAARWPSHYHRKREVQVPRVPLPAIILGYALLPLLIWMHAGRNINRHINCEFRDRIRNDLDVDVNSGKRKFPRRVHFLEANHCLKVRNTHYKLVPSSSW